jgi:hypothetical protein
LNARPNTRTEIERPCVCTKGRQVTVAQNEMQILLQNRCAGKMCPVTQFQIRVHSTRSPLVSYQRFQVVTHSQRTGAPPGPSPVDYIIRQAEYAAVQETESCLRHRFRSRATATILELGSEPRPSISFSGLDIMNWTTWPRRTTTVTRAAKLDRKSCLGEPRSLPDHVFEGLTR